MNGYLTFNLPKGRSLGFASTPTDYTPCSDSLSLRIHISRCLTLPVKVTRRFIMQKARRHCLKQLKPGTLFRLKDSESSLSPPPSAHPEAFQRLSVRSSSQCYLTFNLAKGRSLGFASTPSDLSPCSDSLSLRLRISRSLTLPEKVTRRFIMQKARRHSISCSDRLQAHGFRDYFTLLFEVLFTFPSQYWFVQRQVHRSQLDSIQC